MAAIGRFDRSRGRSIESIGSVGSVIFQIFQFFCHVGEFEICLLSKFQLCATFGAKFCAKFSYIGQLTFERYKLVLHGGVAAPA